MDVRMLSLMLAALGLILLAPLAFEGCGYAPPTLAPAAVPAASAPLVLAVKKPILAAKKDNLAARAQLAAMPLSPPPQVAVARDATQAILVRQAGYLAEASHQVTLAVPAAAAADKAARTHAATAERWRKRYEQLRQAQVQWALWSATAAGGLCVLLGILLAVFTADKVEGAALGVCGGALVALAWFAAAHVFLVELMGIGAVAALAIWMFVGRHHAAVVAAAAAGPKKEHA